MQAGSDSVWAGGGFEKEFSCNVRSPFATDYDRVVESILGHGVYTYQEAAALTGLSAQRVKAWFQGWSGRNPLLQKDYEGAPLLSFLDLIDVSVVGKLRAAGVSVPAVRKAYAALAEVLDSEHPFSRQELLTDDQGQLFVRAVEGEEEVLLELVRRQRAFPKLLLPYLKKIDYDPDSRLAMRLRISDSIILDPSIKCGKPIVRDGGLPTSILFRSYRAMEQDADAVAEWYGIAASEVLAAVCFEEGTAGKAA